MKVICFMLYTRKNKFTNIKANSKMYNISNLGPGEYFDDRAFVLK